MPGRVAVTYDGKSLIPGPFLSMRRQQSRSADGTVRNRGWQITVSGRMLAVKGSPDADGNFHENETTYPDDPTPLTHDEMFAAIRGKLTALSNLFATDGLLFKIQPADASEAIEFRPRWGQLQYPEGKWFNEVPWSIDGETDYISGFDDESIHDQENNPPEESWTLEQKDEVGRVYQLTHSIAAQGKIRYDSVTGDVEAQGWEVARDLVVGGSTAGAGSSSKLGFDQNKLTATSVLGLSDYRPYNYIRNVQVDEGQGRFAVTENWLCFDPADKPTGLTAGTAIEEYVVETRYGNDSGLTSCNFQGTIIGLEERHNTTRALIRTRWQNAELRAGGMTDGWADGIISGTTGITINPKPLSTVIGRNKITGSITYQYTFDNRIGLEDSDNLSEVVAITVAPGSAVVGRIPVPGRAAGPVLQPMNTVTEKTITVSAEIVRKSTYGSPATVPTFNPLPYVIAYLGLTPTYIYQVDERVNWVIQTGRYSKNTSYLYQ